MPELDSLRQLCAPPAAPVGPTTSLGGPRRRMPEAHRELLATYGVGSFDDFLWLYGDGVDNPHLDIWARSESLRSVLHEKPVPEVKETLSPYGLAVRDLVQWGGTDNGDALLWIPVGEPDTWPTLFLEVRQRSLLVAHKTSTSILLELLSGKLQTPIFPDDFPSSRPQFQPYTS
jgi:hypothetical protein